MWRKYWRLCNILRNGDHSTNNLCQNAMSWTCLHFYNPIRVFFTVLFNEHYSHFSLNSNIFTLSIPQGKKITVHLNKLSIILLLLFVTHDKELLSSDTQVTTVHNRKILCNITITQHNTMPVAQYIFTVFSDQQCVAQPINIAPHNQLYCIALNIGNNIER